MTDTYRPQQHVALTERAGELVLLPVDTEYSDGVPEEWVVGTIIDRPEPTADGLAFVAYGDIKKHDVVCVVGPTIGGQVPVDRCVADDPDCFMPAESIADFAASAEHHGLLSPSDLGRIAGEQMADRIIEEIGPCIEAEAAPGSMGHSLAEALMEARPREVLAAHGDPSARAAEVAQRSAPEGGAEYVLLIEDGDPLADMIGSTLDLGDGVATFDPSAGFDGEIIDLKGIPLGDLDAEE